MKLASPERGCPTKTRRVSRSPQVRQTASLPIAEHDRAGTGDAGRGADERSRGFHGQYPNCLARWGKAVVEKKAGFRLHPDGGGTEFSRSASVVALEATNVVVLYRTDFLHFLQSHPATIREIIAVLADRVRRLNDRVEDLRNGAVKSHRPIPWASPSETGTETSPRPPSTTPETSARDFPNRLRCPPTPVRSFSCPPKNC